MRCFVALCPDEAARRRLDAIARSHHLRYPMARRMTADKLHLTLAFIGEIEPVRAAQVATQIAAIAVAPFTWTLDALGAFEGARVLWAGSAVTPPLEALAAEVRRRLDAAAVSYDRKPFAAHVTLLRNLPRSAARNAAQPIARPVAWQVTVPVLLRSDTDRSGTRYTLVAPPDAADFGLDQSFRNG